MIDDSPDSVNHQHSPASPSPSPAAVDPFAVADPFADPATELPPAIPAATATPTNNPLTRFASIGVARLPPLSPEERARRDRESREAAQRQREQIEEARRILKPSPVRLGHIPPWFRKAVLAAFPGEWRHESTAGWSVLMRLQRHYGSAWLDHHGICKWGDAVAFCSELYDVDAERLATVEAIADRLGCEWDLTPNSFHYPGRTTRIVFFPRRTT